MTTTFPVGIAIFPPPAQKVINSIKLAEQLGVPMVWVPSWPVGPDGLTIVTAAAAQTSTIGLATGITVTYPRHPLTLANEASVLAELAPHRFRLGVGAGHQTSIEGIYGLDFGKPLAHLREYITVLRSLLWEGRVDFTGDYFRVHAELPLAGPPPRFPIVLAALRKNMLRLAGEISDGAFVTWSTSSYVQSIALPAMQEGARIANRPRPPLIGSAPIVLDTDFAIVRQRAQAAFALYKSFPTYGKMFQEANYPLTPDGNLSDELIHDLYLYGDPATIRNRLYAMHNAGVDEIVAAFTPVKDPVREERTILEILASI
ncbi:MAG: LLM class flavin-dependent oxidoreductase [Ktedonobacteraceae bacterium]|nr:LLM class flavin-dependent oxidoreductase [Ktedonobacteraceae bacterium]